MLASLARSDSRVICHDNLCRCTADSSCHIIYMCSQGGFWGKKLDNLLPNIRYTHFKLPSHIVAIPTQKLSIGLEQARHSRDNCATGETGSTFPYTSNTKEYQIFVRMGARACKLVTQVLFTRECEYS